MICVPQQIEEWLDDDIPDTVAVYSVATTYAVGDLARVGKYNYKSTLANNIGNNPLETLGIYWIEWSVANDYAMTDLETANKTQWNENTGYVIFARGSKDYIGFGVFNAQEIKIEYIDATDTILDTDTYIYSNNNEVWDEWTYGYGGFSNSYDNAIYKTLKRKGSKIKVTFTNPSADVYVGFMVAGVGRYAGKTIEGVEFPDKRIGTQFIKSYSFTTFLLNTALMRTIFDARQNAEVPMMYIIDDSTTSKFDNIILIGKSTSVPAYASNHEYSTIQWQLEQTNYTE